jgi:hypothetical protein
MMAKEPAARFQKPAEVAAALDQPRLAPSRRRRRLLLGALAAAVLLAAAALCSVIWLSAGKDREIGIETDDPEIEVVVKGDRIVRIVDPKTGKAYRLDRTDLTLAPADDPDGLAITLDGERPIILKRKGKQIATVRLEARPRGVPEAPLERPFNGKDLTGWVVDGGAPGSWRVTEGAIVGTGVGSQKSGFLLTEKSYSDFRLRFEFRLEAGANSGVALRAVPGSDRRRGIPAHVEVQILDDGKYRKPDGSFLFPTGSLFWSTGDSWLDPDRRADLKPLGSWNEMVIEMRGERLQVWVNGRRILSRDLDRLADRPGANPGLKRSSGHIGFQQHTGEVRFRNIEIKAPPPE